MEENTNLMREIADRLREEYVPYFSFCNQEKFSLTFPYFQISTMNCALRLADIFTIAKMIAKKYEVQLYGLTHSGEERTCDPRKMSLEIGILAIEGLSMEAVYRAYVELRPIFALLDL